MNYYPASKITNDTTTDISRFGPIKPLDNSVINFIEGANNNGDLTSIQFKNNSYTKVVIT